MLVILRARSFVVQVLRCKVEMQLKPRARGRCKHTDICTTYLYTYCAERTSRRCDRHTVFDDIVMMVGRLTLFKRLAIGELGGLGVVYMGYSGRSWVCAVIQVQSRSAIIHRWLRWSIGTEALSIMLFQINWLTSNKRKELTYTYKLW